MPVPHVLWKLFGKEGRNRAQTLAKTVLLLIPPPPATAEECRCRGRRPCIRCSGADLMSYLLRPEDPSDYRNLITKGYAVVNPGAPDLWEFVPYNRWTQPEIVRHTIEKLKHESEGPNVIFRGYDKYSNSSTIVDLLTSSAWCTLLTRVGETVMIYLLMHTSIFLPQPKRVHLQVTGSPISALCKEKFVEYKPKERKRMGELNRESCVKRRRMDKPKERKRVGELNRESCPKRRRMDNTNEENGSQTGVYASSSYHHIEAPQDCCVRFLTSEVVDEQTQIDRKSMFYNLEYSRSVFPKKHVLNSLKGNCAGSDFLLKNIFGICGVNVIDRSGPCSYFKHFSFAGSTCLYPALAKMLKNLIHRTKHCQHRRLLDKHCPIPDPMHEAIKSYSSTSQVVSFIWAVCRSITPPALLGTPFNWRILQKNIFKFIRLRRFENFYLKQCMHKLDPSRFLNSPEQKYGMVGGSSDAVYSMKHELVKNWILWLFSSVVVPLVQAHFYVTESDHGKQEVYYYRKSVWKKLTDETFTRLEDQTYRQMGVGDVRSIIQPRKFGFSRLRLRPKENEVRMLANLKAASRLAKRIYYKMPRGFQYFPSVNGALRNIHVVLNGLKLENIEMFGSSVFDYNDVYKQLCPFILGLKNGLGNVPDMFVVACDVSKAYDSIKQDKLLSVMEEVIPDEEYTLQQSHQVICTKNCQWVRQSTGLTRFSSSGFVNTLNSVAIDDDKEVKLRKEGMVLTLKEHVTRNIVQLGKQFYIQGVGIPQGSILSPLLCSLYYGHLERNVVYPFLQNACDYEDLHASPSYKLLRYVDDFLFVSTSKEQASRFFSRFQEGFRDYNCYMNQTKFSLNFGANPPSSMVEDGTSSLCWSGLLINTRTLEVQADYTSYLKYHLRSTLTVLWEDEQGYRTIKKLSGSLRPNCHPIFFDSNINSAATVRLNVYQACLLSAMKTSCYVREISHICKIDAQVYLEVIQKSLRSMYLRMRKMESMDVGPNLRPKLQLEEDEVQWLGLNAHLKALTRKQSQHKELVQLLRSKLSAHRISGRLSSPLAYAIDDSHSSLMWKIKY